MTTSRRALASAVCVLSCLPFSLARGQRASRCSPPDTTKEWYRRQREWASDVRHDWSDDSLRTTLLRAAGVDGNRAFAPQLGVQQRESGTAAPADSALLDRLRSLAMTRGATWPTRSIVGAAGVHALWLLVQRDTALQRAALHRMMESGPDEALAADVAVLEDRVRLQSRRKQLYGTQLRLVRGRLVPAPTEDPAHADMRRDAAGLPPLKAAMCAAASRPNAKYEMRNAQ
jgi:hypothetical protein